MKDKIELTEEMVNTLENPPKANDAFKAAAKKYKGEDIKMADVFDLPLNADIEAVYDCEGGELAAFNKVSEDVAAVHAINNHDKLVKQVKDLEFSLDDRDCYIADADMKNKALTKQVEELRAALQSIKEHQKVVAPSGYEFSTVWSLANKALKESE